MTMPGDITFVRSLVPSAGSKGGRAVEPNELTSPLPSPPRQNSGTSYLGKNLTQAVNNGSVPIERLDDMATRILAGWYLLEQDKPDFPGQSRPIRVFPLACC